MKEKDYQTIVSILCNDYDYKVVAKNLYSISLTPCHYYVGSSSLELIIKHGLTCSVRFNDDIGLLVLTIDKD